MATERKKSRSLPPSMLAREDGAGGSEGGELLAASKRDAAGFSIASPHDAKPAHKARWTSPEFIVYFVWLAFCYSFGGNLVWQLSANAPQWQHRHLQEGWMLGRKVDLADSQYRFFRAELPLLTAAAAGFLVLSRAVRHYSKNSLRIRLCFYALFSFCFLLFVNGSAVAFIVLIISLNYWISSFGCRVGCGRAATVATWACNCLILLANEYYRGYSWRALVYPLSAGEDSSSYQWAVWLDSNRGLVGWHGLFNLVVLRMISFNLDRIWSSEARPILTRDGSVLTFDKHARSCADCSRLGRSGACAWWREKEHHAASEYSPLAYFAYLFYVPLHFAGPTITFNSFLSQVRSPQQTYDDRGVIRYALLKVLLIFFVLEWWLHHFYVFSFTNSQAFVSLKPYELAMVSYFTLVAIWLKFTAVWRFFRCWALIDGVEAPENMQRCVSNNYSIQSFWRSWHRSFNRWLVRYIYVPLGGGGAAPNSPAVAATPKSKLLSVLRQCGNVFLTFSFVAFWHDRTMQLLAWGWLVALLFVPELAAQAVFNLPQLRWLKKTWYWRHIQAAGAAISIFGMMVANLIGYSVGISGTSAILSTIATQGGLSMILVVFSALFAAAQIMFECRATGITVD